MKAKKINFLVSLVIFLLVLGGLIYYLWPKNINEEQAKLDDLLEFKIVKNDMAPELLEKYKNEFDKIKEVLIKDHDNFWALLEIGIVKKYLGDFQGTEAAWLKVNELSPKNSTSFSNLADLYANFIKDYEKAIPMYQIAIANSLGEPKNIMFYRNFYEFYRYYLKNDQKAEDILLEGLANNSKSSELLAVLASFYRDNGDKQKALEYFKQALEFDPKNEAIQNEIKKLKQ